MEKIRSCVAWFRQFDTVAMRLVLLAVSATTLSAGAQAQVVSIATLQQNTLYYSVGAAIAGVMQRQANLQTRVLPMSGSSVYAPIVDRGESEFGLLNAVDVVNAYQGIDNFKGHKNPGLRLVGVMFPLPIGIAVPADSPVKSIKDLKGLRMPSQFTAQSTISSVQDAILATGGLSNADMKPFPVANMYKGIDAFGQGKVDASLFALGSAIVQEANIALASHGGLRFLPLSDTPEAMAAMHKVFPSAYTQVYQPKPAFVGIIAPTRLMVYSAFLVTSTHVPDDMVYKATKAIYGNKPMLAAASATMKTFDPATMAELSPVPYHPGAEKFYKEVGEWPPRKR